MMASHLCLKGARHSSGAIMIDERHFRAGEDPARSGALR